MPHKDPVTQEVVSTVTFRDLRSMIDALVANGHTARSAMSYLSRKPVCIAPVIDPNQWETCSGRSTYEHVKDHLRMGKRAPSDIDHLVTLCEGHTEAGAKAGFQWNTHADNRARVRDYLSRYRS